MSYRFFLVVGLLSSYTGGCRAHDQPEQVLAFAGEDVILPCNFSISDSSDFPTVEWSKEGLNPNVVFLYRDGCETYEMKNPAFEYRTSLIMKELKNGNISLRISNVQVSDAGRYQCLRFLRNARREVTLVELVVVAVSEPKLSVVSADSDGVTLQCEASCLMPEPQIIFLDDQGNNISTENPKREQHASGCFTVRQRVILQSATSSVICRVHQLEFNQTRDSKILIPAFCKRSNFKTIAIAIGGTAMFFLVTTGLIVLLHKKLGKSANVKQQVSRNSLAQTTKYSENQLLLDQRETISSNDNLVNIATEQLQRKNEFHMEDEIFHPLQSNKVALHDQPTIVQSHSTSTPDIQKLLELPIDHGSDTINLPSVHNPKPSSSSANSYHPKSSNLPQSRGSNPGAKGQNSNPAPGQPFQRIHRVHSSPATFNLAPSTSSLVRNAKKKLICSSHEMVESGSSSNQTTVPPLRRHSCVLPLLAQYKTHYNPLANLIEE